MEWTRKRPRNPEHDNIYWWKVRRDTYKRLVCYMIGYGWCYYDCDEFETIPKVYLDNWNWWSDKPIPKPKDQHVS